MKCTLTYLVIAICWSFGSSMELNGINFIEDTYNLYFGYPVGRLFDTTSESYRRLYVFLEAQGLAAIPIPKAYCLFTETSPMDFPPMYHFDEWIQCRRPKDMYCLVDAVLFSSTPSPLLEYIKEYSAYKQKHFNRTVIHRGVCMTRCGADGPDTYHDAAQRCINKSLVDYGLEAKVLPIRFCSSPEGEKPSMSAKAFGIVYLIILALTLLATVVHALGRRCGWLADNKYILALSLKRNWQLLTSVRSNSELENQKTYCDFSCFEGVRFIGMVIVVLTHVSLTYILSYVDNPEFVEHLYDSFSGKAGFNSLLWMQVFFSITGFLTTYLALVYSEKSTLTFFKCCLAIINRYIRITPVVIFTLWFTITWYPRFGSGPHSMLQAVRESQDCSERWWHHVLYIHNYLPLGKFCMGHTWYLGADMQLHVLGMFLLLLFIRFRRTVKPVIFLILLGFIILSGLLAYFYDIKPIITVQQPEYIISMFKDSQDLRKFYLAFWINLSGYFLGVASAFIHYNNQVNGIQLNEIKWFKILYHLSLGIAIIVTLLGVVFLGDERLPRVVEIIYSSLDRFTVALCFNIFILGCVSNCKSILGSALLWPGFRMLGRLSYSVFMIHFIILRFTFDTNTQLGHISTYSMISALIGGAVTSYIVAIPIYLIIEIPPVQLWKAFLSNNKQKPRQDPPIKLNGSSRRSGVPA